MGFTRDYSGRFTYDLSGVTAMNFPAICHDLAESLRLIPAGDIVAGLDQMFWDFTRDNQLVCLAWDIWFDFMAVAPSPSAEPLVHEIAEWLGSRLDAAPSDTPGRSTQNPRHHHYHNL